MAILLAAFAIAVAVIQWNLLFGAVAEPMGDLEIYRGAVRHAADGGSLYDYAYVRPERPSGYPFTYPPFAAVVLQPLAWMPKAVSDRVWTLGTMLLSVVLATTLVSRVSRDGSTWIGQEPTRARLVGVMSLSMAALLLSVPVLHNLAVGQISLAIITMTILDASGVVPRRFQGSLVGLAAATKLTPLIFIPYYIVTRQFRQAAIASGVFFSAAAVGWLAHPTDSVMYWTDKMLDTSRVGEPWSSLNKSMLGLLSRWGIGGDLQQLVWLGLCALVTFAALYRARRHYLEGEPILAAIVMGCVSVAVTPISWPHHQTWAVLAGLFLAMQRRPLHLLMGAIILGAFVIWSPWVSTEESGSLALRLGWELPTAIFVLISILGMPRALSRDRDT